jgi:putative molybdopterin biosynthesis protein
MSKKAPSDESEVFLNVHEAADLLGVNAKKVYVLAGEGKIPGTKVTGKWLFPKNDLLSRLRQESMRALAPDAPHGVTAPGTLLAAGSDDPALAILHGLLHRNHPQLALYATTVGSREGLRLLRERACQVAFCHLYDGEQGEQTFPFLRRDFPNPEELVVVNLFYRHVGFVSREPVDSFRTIAARGLRFVNRQAGSGTRARIEQLLAEEGVEPAKVNGYDLDVFTHLSVALQVSSGGADAGVASEAVARLGNLHFTPLYQERFDLVAYKGTFFDRKIQSLIELVRSSSFRQTLEQMGGYDVRQTGTVVYPNNQTYRNDTASEEGS